MRLAPRSLLIALAPVVACTGSESEGTAAAEAGSVDDGSVTSSASGSSSGASASSASSAGSASSSGPGSSSGSSGTGGSTDTTADTGSPGTLAPGTRWQWQLTGTIDTTVDVAMYDVDLFDAPDDVLATLAGDGRVVVCYFSAGSHEDWRPDAADFPPAAIGDPLDGRPGEHWLDIRDAGVRTVLAARLDLAVTRGCDGVEPDNVDGYANATGFPLSGDDQLDFNGWLAEEAHARGLSVGLKNDLDQVPALVDRFDWALDEECVAFDECAALAPFIDANKAVFHVEYVDEPAQGQALADSVCPQTQPLGFSTLIKTWDLDAWRIECG